MDRVIRVHVLDRNGRSIPDATVSVLVNGELVGTATSGWSAAGTVYTIQIDDGAAEVGLEAEYADQPPQAVTLTQDAHEWRFHFDNVEVPVADGKPFWQQHIAGLLGVIFLLTSIGLAVFIATPTEFQRRVFVGALAIGLAGIGAEIPGFLHVKLSLGTQLAVTAAGALAIFVIVYFFVPA